MDADYQRYKNAIAGRLLPLAFVDLDRFDRNVADVLARAGKMPICVASKSVRCAALLKRIQAASTQFHAFMGYSAREAVYLCEQGLDNILVAYPVWSEARHSGLCDQLRAGKRITLMVDSVDQIAYLNALGAERGCVIPLCIDLDMSSSFPGIHFGVRRSPIQTPEQAVALWNAARTLGNVRLDGLMGYEAQIAGVQDQVPGKMLKNFVVSTLKKRSLREVVARRAAVVKALQAAGCTLRFVNGGGTGSVESTIQEEVVTEVTVGSGFYCPTLFDHYGNFKHQPAAGFAIEVVRKPTAGIYTCHGGGYIASGPAGTDRLPRPYLPQGATLLPLEGAGEVQTPVVYDGPVSLGLGDPVFFRHSKAGELCERFKTLLLISGGAVVDEVPTYRGDGQCFL